mmetsp:Transcript_3574/g.11991  ORF Transcript_3574/g.11991 Transcript_3574/m.11991 type:complete len:465 (+) Transcript_3574:174-1568(+)
MAPIRRDGRLLLCAHDDGPLDQRAGPGRACAHAPPLRLAAQHRLHLFGRGPRQLSRLPPTRPGAQPAAAARRPRRRERPRLPLPRRGAVLLGAAPSGVALPAHRPRLGTRQRHCQHIPHLGLAWRRAAARRRLQPCQLLLPARRQRRASGRARLRAASRQLARRLQCDQRRRTPPRRRLRAAAAADGAPSAARGASRRGEGGRRRRLEPRRRWVDGAGDRPGLAPRVRAVHRPRAAAADDHSLHRGRDSVRGLGVRLRRPPRRDAIGRGCVSLLPLLVRFRRRPAQRHSARSLLLPGLHPRPLPRPRGPLAARSCPPPSLVQRHARRHGRRRRRRLDALLQHPLAARPVWPPHHRHDGRARRLRRHRTHDRPVARRRCHRQARLRRPHAAALRAQRGRPRAPHRRGPPLASQLPRRRGERRRRAAGRAAARWPQQTGGGGAENRFGVVAVASREQRARRRLLLG